MSWVATEEQKARIAAFEQWSLSFLKDLKDQKFTAELQGKNFSSIVWAQKSGQDFHPVIKMFFDTPFADDLERHLADYYFFPSEVKLLPNEKRCIDMNRDDASVLDRLCRLGLKFLGKEYSFNLAIKRLEFQLLHPESIVEMQKTRWEIELKNNISPDMNIWVRNNLLEGLERLDNNYYKTPFLSPDPDATLIAAIGLIENHNQLERLLELIFKPVRMLDKNFVPALNVNRGECEKTMSTLEYYELGSNSSKLFQKLIQLSVADQYIIPLFEFETSGYHCVLRDSLSPENNSASRFRQVGLDWLYEKTKLPVGKAIDFFSYLGNRISSAEISLKGSRFILAAVAIMQQQKAEGLKVDAESMAQAYRFLSRSIIAPEESHSMIIDQLKSFKSAALEGVFAYVGSGKNAELILRSLGFDKSIPLFYWLVDREIAEVNECFDANLAKSLLAECVDEAEGLMKLIKSTKRVSVAFKRLEAVQGIADKKMESMLGRYSQEHIRLYGLLPITNHEDLQNRYKYFRSAGKEASKMYGSERTANVKDAAASGLLNLAVVGGFSDLAEMEWTIDARSGENLPMQITIDDYQIAIEINLFKPEWSVSKQGKKLKAIPPAVKKNPDLKPLLNCFDLLKDQSKRYRQSIENLMVSGRWLDAEKLREITRLPMAANMFAGVVFRTKAGVSGIATDQFQSLSLLDGAVCDLAETVQIAHAYQLLEDGNLAQWQQQILARNICQPFKQVFRECYLVTPAEKDAGLESARFSGRKVRTRILGATLGGRGWRVEGGEGSWVATKKLGDNFVGEVELPDVYHYLTEDETTTIGGISFKLNNQSVALIDVPVIGFSEFMRDLDLVITVGAADDQDIPSAESISSRVALLQYLLPQLGLKNVSIKEHFAMISGKRANYRVHLGTAVIHIMPGSYLCIVPADKASPAKVELPFVDEDARTSEIISKILLLSADQKIKDASILQQIERKA
jgi:hypothetical protein